jgi:hypothetical protein
MRWNYVTLASMSVATAALCIGIGIHHATAQSARTSQGIVPTPDTLGSTGQPNSPMADARPAFVTFTMQPLGPGPEHVLFYEDHVLGQSAYTSALNLLGWSYTFTNDPAVFAAQLALSGYTHVIAAHQNAPGAQVWETPLLSWIANNPGKTVLISDWRVNEPSAQAYLASLGFSYGAINPSRIIPIAGPCFSGLAAADIVSPGWGVYSYETLGGTAIANTPTGAPIIARNGNVFFNGFLSDSIGNAGLAAEYVIRELLKCGQAQCPTCIGDLNGNGVVDGSDLLLLLANWGVCPQEGCSNGFVCTPPYQDYECGSPGDGCVCFHRFGGGFACGLHGFCTTPCPTGVCPAGMVCAVDTCCGGPYCLAACPSALGDTPDQEPGRPGEATSNRPAHVTER